MKTKGKCGIRQAKPVAELFQAGEDMRTEMAQYYYF